MPVRSSTSSVLRWPDAETVLTAAREWAIRQAALRPEITRVGVFGSYARGDAGVGSDLDLVAVVRETAEPFERRGAAWDATELPVPAELLVYTEREWQATVRRGGRFAAMLGAETKWLVDRSPEEDHGGAGPPDAID